MATFNWAVGLLIIIYLSLPMVKLPQMVQAHNFSESSLVILVEKLGKMSRSYCGHKHTQV